MSRLYVWRLATGTVCMVLAACGGGERSNQTTTGTGATGSTLLEEPSTKASNPTLSQSEIQAWDRSAALSRGEVEQSAEWALADVPPTVWERAAVLQAYPKAVAAPTAEVYRFFNTQTGAHLFTKSTSERDSVIKTLPQFKYEGPVFSAWNTTAAGLLPVYRFYNTLTGAHFYTISESEKSNILATLPWMHLDGPAYFASPTAQSGTTPLYRFYQLQKGFHFYTASVVERDSIVANLPTIYRYEGIGYYVNDPAVLSDEALARSKNCMLCHSINTKMVGPTFMAVATKYAGTVGAIDYLATKIRKGGVGVWGAVPMPAMEGASNGQVTEAEATRLAIWILSL